MSQASTKLEPVAIIGMGCRFPGAPDLASFWRMLHDGNEAITTVPADRWDADAYYDPDPAAPGKMNSRAGAFLDEIDQFDSAFFGIAPREADLIDPQHRLIMEVAWEALENAALVPATLAGKPVGVYMGLTSANYSSLLQEDLNLVTAFTNSGGSPCIAANRISYMLDLRGPSIMIDTACSSALVAVQMACQSLWTGECELAIAGGVNVILLPTASISLAKARMLSPDGRCRVFDAGANGFGRGEGAGVVVLKPLSRAITDGDPIHAVIRGGATQQNGRTNGLMAPSRWAQEAVVRDACRRAGVAPSDLQYIECHSAGTLIGDATELNALGSVLAEGRAPGHKCAIGSVKTNIGHLEGAAGIAGLIKVALMLKNRALAPSLHYTTPNPHAPINALPLRVQTESAAWRADDPIAGVSASGYGGMNAHVILAAAPIAESPTTSGSNGERCVLVLSARTDKSLRALAHRYVEFLTASPETSLADLCFTAAVGRSHFAHRLAIAAASIVDVRQKLDAFVAGRECQDVCTGIAARRATASPGTASAGFAQDSLAARYVTGDSIDWRAIHGSSRARRIALPTYAFDRQRHWVPLPHNRRAASITVPLDQAICELRQSAEDPPVQDPGRHIVPAGTDIEKALVKIWQRVLGAKSIGITDDFFELGGGSLMVLEMFADIAKELNVELVPSVLFERPTIQQLAREIEQRHVATEAPPLVSISPGDGQQAPVFLVAPDHLLHYTQLIRRFGPDMPLFGLQPPYPDGFREPGMTIEQMAKLYVGQVEQTHPGGTCHIIGFCAGGVIAFEMAQELRKRGREMGLLAMIDAPCPPTDAPSQLSRFRYFWARLAAHAKVLCELSVRDALLYSWERVLALCTTLAPIPLPKRPTERSAAISSIANRAAIYRYRPRPYPGRIDLFNAEEPYPSKAEDTRVQWKGLASDARVCWLKGNHNQIMYAPQLDRIIEQIGNAMADVEHAQDAPQPARIDLATPAAQPV